MSLKNAITLFGTSIGDILLNAAQIAAISGGSQAGQNAIGTNTTTTGTTLVAAQMTTGILNRSGPTAAFSDTTDTAANIAALTGAPAVYTQAFKNLTAFPMTLNGGSGVTMSAKNVIPPNSVANYLINVNAAGAVTFSHVGTTFLTSANPEAPVALATVGAGVITGQGIATQLTTRSGTQVAAFTDTTDTAANIISAQPNSYVGQSWEWIYNNNTVFPATITQGSGVTMTNAVVPANSWARFLVTYSAAGAITLQLLSQGYFPTSGTFTMNGATPVVVAAPNVTAGSVIVPTLKTVGGTPHAFTISAITPGTGFSVTGTSGDTSVYNYVILG